ncbi:breast cancer type 2 susceptibility protein homolog [Drosophila takahashii]|uniref:breast cancer type 2 susceptibility protein homolog n=1 Tax=Drosophila takahashii TaxID=29030 RepID=UPI001CF8A769|nr:breast cancer type 2 susceptibility protein homolog [Drosophila takahashii]
MDQDEEPASSKTPKDNAPATNQLSRSKGTHLSVDKPGNQRLPGNIMAEMARIYQADRENSLKVRQNQGQDRGVADSSDFVALEDLILAQSDPTPQEVVENILQDFCSSPSYVEEEDKPTCESPPWFRFRRKRIKTYSRKRVPQREDLPVVVENEEQDRLSCSSDLSIQEDLNATSTSAICALDVNTSQKIRENLLNLSQYFSLGSTASNPQIDLPLKVRRDSEKPSCSREIQNRLSDTNSSGECSNTEIQTLKDDLLENGFTFEASQICDNKPQVPGDTLFGDSRQTTTISHSQLAIKCDDWSETDSFLEDYNTEKMALDVEDSKPQKTLIDKIKTEPEPLKVENPDLSVLDDIPISEWLVEMDVPDKSVEETKEPPQEIVKLEPNSQITREEAEDFVGFRTASNKPIEVSEETLQRAAKLLADFEGGDSLQPKLEQDQKDSSMSDFVGFRTASNKAIEMTKEMERKGAMFIAQFKAADQPSQTKDEDFLEGIVFSQWQPIDNPDVPSTSKKLMEKIRKNEIELPEKKTPVKNHAMNIPQLVAFRKTPYKFIEVPEEMRVKGDKLIAEVESGLYQPSQKRRSQTQENPGNHSQVNGTTEFVGFKTASNKPIEISEEMKRKAAKFMAEVEAGEIKQPILKETTNESEFVGFRTASNKSIVISEEMRNKAANLMAEVAAGETSKKLTTYNDDQTENTEDTSESFGFRTASNKRIEISEEMRRKAAKLMESMQIAENEEKSSNSSDKISVEEFRGFQTNDDLFLSMDEDSNESIFPRLSQRTQNKLDCKDDSSVITPKRRRDTSDGIPSSKRPSRERNSPLPNAPQSSRQLMKTKSCQNELGTPRQSQEIHASLSQLAGLSPLDKTTKTSVIARRNLLSLSKMRKKSSTTSTITPAKPRFAPMPASTSTPLADRNSNLAKDSKGSRQNAEDMSPICMPANKSRKLGLSRNRY